MGSKPPTDVESDFESREHKPPSTINTPSTSGWDQTLQKPTDETHKELPTCTYSFSTPQQFSEAENIAFKKKKEFKKPAGLSRRQLFKEDSAQVEGESLCKTEIVDEDESIPTFLHPCLVCKKDFFSFDDLSHHLEIHKIPSSISYPTPSTSSAPYPPNVPIVSTSSSKASDRPFVCGNCSKAFSSKFKLMRHVLIHSDERQYCCTSCDKTFHRKDHLKNHIKVHNPVKRRYKCEKKDCGKEYSSILSFKKHNAVHSVEEGSLDCKICGIEFSSKEDIVTHLKIHSGSRTMKTPADRKYHCEHCDRSFFTGKDVRRHMVVHTGRRDFLCQFCPQRFGRKDHLTRHIKKSHSNSSKKSRIKKTSQTTKKIKPVVEIPLAYPKEEDTSHSESIFEMLNEVGSVRPGFFDDSTCPTVSTNPAIKEEFVFVTVPETSMYVEPTASTSSDLVVTDHVFEEPKFQTFNEEEICETSEGLTSLIELLPVSDIDPLASSEPPFIETGNDDRTFHNINTNEFMSLYLDPSDQTNYTTPLPRFSQAFHHQHQPPDQELLVPISEHSSDNLHSSNPNSN